MDIWCSLDGLCIMLMVSLKSCIRGCFVDYFIMYELVMCLCQLSFKVCGVLILEGVILSVVICFSGGFKVVFFWNMIKGDFGVYIVVGNCFMCVKGQSFIVKMDV